MKRKWVLYGRTVPFRVFAMSYSCLRDVLIRRVPRAGTTSGTGQPKQTVVIEDCREVDMRLPISYKDRALARLATLVASLLSVAGGAPLPGGIT
jgi:hypothetical protein